MSSNTQSKRRRADAPSGWQPIGLPVPPSAPEVPTAFFRASLPSAKAIRLAAVPGAALTASVAMVGVAAAAPATQGATADPLSSLLSTASGTTPGLVTPDVTTPQVNATQPNPDTNLLDGGGFLPSIPGFNALLPHLDGTPTLNTQTPGGATTVPGASYGTPSDIAQAYDGTDTYPSTASQTVDATDGGWYGYQEYSPWCWSRGVSCVNWNFSHEQENGNGFLRINGTSLGVAPCVPNTGVGRFNSPLFTYNTRNAKSWKIDFDFRTTNLVGGDGHSTFSISLVDEAGNVITTAHGPHDVLPTNHWDHFANGFDGSKLVFGKKYRLSISVDVIHAETALTWGNLDFDNLRMTATPGNSGETNSLGQTIGMLPTEGSAGTTGNAAGPLGALSGLLPGGTTPGKEEGSTPGLDTPYIICKPSAGDDPIAAITGLLSSRPEDFCQPANALGQAASPLADVAEQIMSQPSISGLLDKASGAFAVLDLQTGDFAGWVIGKGALPSTDPRDLVAYVKDGGIGQVGNYAVMFVTNTAGMVADIAQNPIPSAIDVAQGQLGNALQLISDPGRLTRIPLDWQVGNLDWMLETIINPVINQSPRDTEIGGTVWADNDQNGKLDAGEPGVPGVKVTLRDANGNVYGTTTSGPDGRYVFTNLTPRTDPSDYYVTFAPGSLPQGSGFTQEEAPGTTHGDTSYADPTTGTTPRIRLVRYQKDLDWNAGLIGVPSSATGSAPGTAPVTGTSGQPGLSGNPLDSLTSTLSSLTGGLPTGGLPGSNPAGGSSNPLDSLTGALGGLTGGLPTGSNPAGGSSNPLDSLTGALGGLTGGLPTGSNPTGNASNPLDSLTGMLGGLTGGLPAGGTTDPSQPTGSDPLSTLTGALGGLTGGLPTGGLTGSTPTSGNPTGSNPAGGTADPAQPTGSAPLSSLTGALGGLTGGLPTGSNPTSGNPTGSNPTSGTTEPSQPATTKPTSSDPLSTLTTALSGLTGALPTGGLTGNNPAGQTPTTTSPTGSTPGQQPATIPIDQPTATQPAATQPADVAFNVGAPTLNGTPAVDAPGPNVPAGQQMRISVPVTNTGSATITSLTAQVPGTDGTLQEVPCAGTVAPGATADCTLTLPARAGNVSYTLNIVGTSADGTQQTKLCRIHYVGTVAAPQLQITPAAQPTSTTDGTSTLPFTITNTGQTTVTSVTSNAQGGTFACGFTSLAPGATGTCTLTYPAQQGSHTLTIPVRAIDADGGTATATFTYHYEIATSVQ